MKRFILSLLMCLLFFYGNAQSASDKFNIIPIPAELNPGTGHFKIDASSKIGYTNQQDKKVAELVREHIKNTYQLNLALQEGSQGKSVIHFSSQESDMLRMRESYELSVSPGRIVVKGKEAGLFYGLQTLLQLLPEKNSKSLDIPAVSIKDQPLYAYRGLHLDVSRHMFPVSFIKKYIDYMAAYKLNNFHWHLTDDQGWRIEIKKYPRLTAVGAYREETMIGRHNQGPNYNFDGTPYGGFYTQQEIKEVVAYAAAKHVNVIPEIEMPGHALAALAAYPELACGDRPGPFKVAAAWGVFEDVFCAGKEQTFETLEGILDEVMELFPSSYIHIGGDESPKVRWKACANCQKRIKEQGLKDEHELQSYFVQRMEKYLNSKGRKIIGWDEILEGGLAPNATVMSWRGESGGIAAAKQGHDVIMTAHSNGLYFDLQQSLRDQQEPLNIGGYAGLEKVYLSEPTPKGLTLTEHKYILGVQANLWTEYIATTKKVEYMLFPRLFALAEIAWSKPESKQWEKFSGERVATHLATLDKVGTTYRVPEVIGLRDTSIHAPSYTIERLQPSVKGGKIYYTIDNFDPGDTDLEYTGPVTISAAAGKERIFKAVVISPSGRKSNYITLKLSNAPAK